MRFYNAQHPFSCGIDLHARSMYVCILNQDGEIRLHRNMQASPETFLKAIAPSREAMVVAVTCLFAWYWLADLCAQEGSPFVLGHALSMQAIHGGKATNDTIDAHKIAVLLRGGRRSRPTSLRPPCGRPGTCCGAACLSRGNGPSCWRTARRRTVSITCPRWGKSWPTQPTAPGSPSGSLIPPCRRVWQWTWRCVETMSRGCVLSSCLASKRPSSTMPTPCISSRRCPASGPSCASSCCLRATIASGALACRIASPLAASSRVPKHRRAHARGPQGPREAMPLSRGPSRKRRCSCAGPIPPATSL